jgi:hypothetical protein
LWGEKSKDLKSLKVIRGRPQTPSRIHRMGESHFCLDRFRHESSGKNQYDYFQKRG